MSYDDPVVLESGQPSPVVVAATSVLKGTTQFLFGGLVIPHVSSSPSEMEVSAHKVVGARTGIVLDPDVGVARMIDEDRLGDPASGGSSKPSIWTV